MKKPTINVEKIVKDASVEMVYENDNEIQKFRNLVNSMRFHAKIKPEIGDIVEEAEASLELAEKGMITTEIMMIIRHDIYVRCLNILNKS